MALLQKHHLGRPLSQALAVLLSAALTLAPMQAALGQARFLTSPIPTPAVPGVWGFHSDSVESDLNVFAPLLLPTPMELEMEVEGMEVLAPLAGEKVKGVRGEARHGELSMQSEQGVVTLLGGQPNGIESERARATASVLDTNEEAMVWNQAAGDWLHGWRDRLTPEVTRDTGELGLRLGKIFDLSPPGAERMASHPHLTMGEEAVLANLNHGFLPMLPGSVMALGMGRMVSVNVGRGRGLLQQLQPKPLVLKGHKYGVKSASFSPDGTKAVTGGGDTTAIIWDAQTGQQLQKLQEHQDWITSASFSPDGTKVVTGSYDKTAIIWDAQTGQQLQVLQGHQAWIRSASFSPDGKKVVTSSEDNSAIIWDAQTGRQFQVLQGHHSWVHSASFSPDGKKVVTGSGDNTAIIWDAQTGQQLQVLQGHQGWIKSASFSPDGTKVVTGGRNKTAIIWDAQTGVKLQVLEGHQYGVNSASFSPDGTKIVTASDDKTAIIWDAQTGEKLQVLKGHEYGVTSASFSPDGAKVVTASVDETAIIWKVGYTPEELAQLEEALSKKAQVRQEEGKGKQPSAREWFKIQNWDASLKRVP